MQFLYQRTEQQRFSVEIGYYQTFGMECWQTIAGKPTLIAVIPDISTDGHFVALLAACFTMQQLSPLHLTDAILDAIE